MREHVEWFSQVLTAAIQLYFRQECRLESIEEVQPPRDGWLEQVTGQPDIRFEERVVVMLALMPHVRPQALDIFFVQNRDFDRQYTEFGGWKGLSHGGFLPTGETASFIIAGDDTERRGDVLRLFGREHWFYRKDILRLEGAGEGEPLLSGQLRVSDGFLSRVLLGEEYKPDYSTGFPAKRVTTELEWKDLVLDYRVSAELEEINTWIASHKTVMEDWGLSRYLKAGYRALFYGPPGTGKTLAATLLGKKNKMDVYRVDLSMIVSKYIGETEKNLARVFDMAENLDTLLRRGGCPLRQAYLHEHVQRPARQPGGGLPATAHRGLPRHGHPRHQPPLEHRRGVLAPLPVGGVFPDARRGTAPRAVAEHAAQEMAWKKRRRSGCPRR